MPLNDLEEYYEYFHLKIILEYAFYLFFKNSFQNIIINEIFKSDPNTIH
jgi:hypothetical protein